MLVWRLCTGTMGEIVAHCDNVYEIEKVQGDVCTVNINPYEHTFVHI